MPIPFTNIALVCAALPWTRACGVCMLWGSTVSFTLAPVLGDPTVYARMRRHRGWSVGLFYLGHLVLHLVPAVLGLVTGATPIGLRDGVWAAAVHAAWARLAGGPDLILAAVYVPLPRRAWHHLLVSAWLTELLLAPLLRLLAVTLTTPS